MHVQEPLHTPLVASARHEPQRGLVRRIGSLLQRIERRLGLYTLQLFRADMAAPCAPADDAPLTIRLLHVAEAVAAAGDPELDMRPAWARDAYRRGDRCLGAFLDGRIVGYVWLSRARALADEGVSVPLPDRVQYRFKTYVRAAHRGRGVASRLYRAADRLAASDGLSYAVLCISPYNPASAAAARRAGARRVGFLLLWRRAGRQRAWLSPGAGRNGLYLDA